METLVKFAQLKTQAERVGIEAMDRRGSALQIKFHPGSKIEPVKLMALVSSREGAQFTPAGVLKLPLPATGEPAEVLDFIEHSLKVLSAASETALWGPLDRGRRPVGLCGRREAGPGGPARTGRSEGQNINCRG